MASSLANTVGGFGSIALALGLAAASPGAGLSTAEAVAATGIDIDGKLDDWPEEAAWNYLPGNRYDRLEQMLQHGTIDREET